MALINCRECGKEISENATTCPRCGNPNTLTKEDKAREIEEKQKKIEEKEKQENKNSTIAVVCTIGGVLLFFALIAFLWKDLEGDKMLDAFGVNTSNNTITVKEKGKDQVKDDIMDWLGFEKE